MTNTTNRVLIVTGSFIPAMMADMHRCRQLAYELPSLGWEVDILTPGIPYQQPTCIELESECLRPNGVPVHEVNNVHWINRMLGLHSIGYRSLVAMYQTGLKLLRQKAFNLIYFSTAQFPLFCLGRLWESRAHVPYILDFHDPWYRGNIKYVTSRSKAKYYAANLLGKYLERYAVAHASGIIAVSQRYLDELKERYYEALSDTPMEEIPFAGAIQDFSCLRNESSRVPSCTELRLNYVGIGTNIMAKSFRKICSLLEVVKGSDPERFSQIRIVLDGTDPAGGVKALKRIAIEVGMSDIVLENTRRIGYVTALATIRSSNGLLILGVDDPGYVPSKLFTYALSGRPLLACLHPSSPALNYFREIPSLGQCVTFQEKPEYPSSTEITTFLDFLRRSASPASLNRESQIRRFLAREMAERHSQFFQRCLPRGRRVSEPY